MKLEQDFFNKYISTKKRHKNYLKSLDVYHHISFHVDGYFYRPWSVGEATKDMAFVNPYFQRLIDSRRPSETDIILEYRRKGYLPITKVPCNKVISSLSKIVKCSDWIIDYSISENPPTLADDMTLEYYCEKTYPKDDSLENWTYRSLMKWLLIDPNALICIMPLSWPEDQSELLRPYAHIIQCKDVYDYRENELAVFLSPYESEYFDKDGKCQSGKIIIAVDRDAFHECRQVGDDKYEIIEHLHNIGEMPAFLLGGESKTPDMIQPFYESFISPMLPSLDAAAGDSSDLFAEKVQHLFSTMWYIKSGVCNSCQGIGNTMREGKQIICPTCDGRGNQPKSPYRDYEIDPNNQMWGQSAMSIPTPPAGYVTKPTEMVGLMRKEIQIEIHDALAAINMEFLTEKPLNESGIAKEVDRDELNNFVYKIGYHLVESILSPIYYFINEMRYKDLIQDKKIREKMLPKIPVPQNFELFKVREAEDNLIKIAASNVSGEIKDLAEIEFLNERYQENPEIRNRMIIMHEHSPLKSYSIDNIESLLQNNLVKKVDAILTIYINDFADELLKDHNNEFLTYNFDKQREILYKMAQTKLDEIDSMINKQEIINIPQEKNPVTDVPNKIENVELGDKPRKKERNDLTKS